MSKLALDGGRPIFETPLDWRTFWPPVDFQTAEKLTALYLSRRWSAFDEEEKEFATAFAAHHGAKHAIFMANGTVTLQCALGALGVGPGDEVIVPPFTWYATAAAVLHAGATPVFVDIEPDSLCLDPEKVRRAITHRTKALIPVHAFGSMADLDKLRQLANDCDLRLIEDCAHVHGAVWGGKGVGTIGDVGSFSFQLGKTMASGEGGMCITDNPSTAEKLFRASHIGYGPGEQPGKTQNGPPLGLQCYNFRATAFQALMLNRQLGQLPDLLHRYEAAVRRLEERLSATTKMRFQSRGRRADLQSYFGWVMIFDHNRYKALTIDRLQQAIMAEGLPILRAYHPTYRFMLFNAASSAYRVAAPCAVTEATCDRMLWLMHPYLGLDDQKLDSIAAVFEKVLSNLTA